MTEAIPKTSPPPVTPVAPPPAAGKGFEGAGEGSGPTTTVEISRAAHAPVYVYTLLDAVTGRTLVQLPFASKAEAQPGRKLDTTI